jgi:hypothetical protein
MANSWFSHLHHSKQTNGARALNEYARNPAQRSAYLSAKKGTDQMRKDMIGITTLLAHLKTALASLGIQKNERPNSALGLDWRV